MESTVTVSVSSSPPNRSASSMSEQEAGETERNQEINKVLSVIESLKKKVAADRCDCIKKKIEENGQKLIGITNHFLNLSNLRRDSAGCDDENLLTKRRQDAISMFNGVDLNNGEDQNEFEEDNYASSAVLLGASFGARNVIPPIKLPEVKNLPPYTTWIFLDRNQRMTEDQSIVGRRRIYYDQNGGEALICSDSEEEVVDDEEEKREFTGVEDYILRMTIAEIGLSDAVLDSLAQCFSRKSCEVEERHNDLVKGDKVTECLKKGDTEDGPQLEEAFLSKDLEAALDSFDNLFCRRCLVFDCRLHGCSQDLVFPVEKQSPWSSSDEDKKPCSSHCYQLAHKLESIARTTSSITPDVSEERKAPLSNSAWGGVLLKTRAVGSSLKKKPKSIQCESASSSARNASESSESEIRPQQDSISIQGSSPPRKNKIVSKLGVRKRKSKRVAERVHLCIRKRQRKMDASDSDSGISGCLRQKDLKHGPDSHKNSEDASSSSQHKVKSPVSRKSRKKESPVNSDKPTSVEISGSQSYKAIKDPHMIESEDTSRKAEFFCENIDKIGDNSWKAIEKGLFTKGLEIFGRNSCLITRNLLNGMKTCAEVYQYMSFTESKLLSGAGDGASSPVEGHFKNSELRTRSRFMRRRGKVRRLKYSWKSAAYSSIRKRITEKKDQPCRQYNPCGCLSACGKQCSCLLNGTCCEKYCGCPKSCKFRFRGCHCAKSQCRSRQCPCFAANRECDPDVCRNCCLSCGDGNLGGPSQGGDNYECRNMKLLLKQQQRVLLGRSDVSGWGAFLKNNVAKHEYLGEYTGELISHREADKRGKIYDRENSSFLFNLNDQFVLDAFRKGDKLKFANHSPNPNCYAKVLMVAGDHRVGIFAKERISAGEELFYDYRYEPDHAPAWARKPETLGARKDDGGLSSGRAKKLA